MAIKITVNDSQGLVQKTASSGGVVGAKQARSASGTFVAGTPTIISSAITIPANSLITAYHVVATSDLARAAAGNMGVKFGISDDDDKFVALDPDSLHAVGDNVATLPAGEGGSSDLNISLSLDNAGNHNTDLVSVAGIQKIGDDDVDIFGTIVSVGNFTAGTAQFIIEFITFS
tara:strand:- start:315 stop:836 length:522 start_codon:yes stop_codon:yes gene_type:complete